MMRPGAQKTALLGTFGSHRAGQCLGLGLKALKRGDGATLDARAREPSNSAPGRRRATPCTDRSWWFRRRSAPTRNPAHAKKRKEHGVGGNLNLDLAAVERKGKIDEFGSH